MQERVLGTIERYGLRRPVSLQEKPPVIFGGAFDVMESWHVDRSFIDQAELDREKIRLASALEQAFELRSGTRIGVASQKEAARWNGLEERIDDLIYIAAAQNRIVTEIEEGNPNSRSILEIALHHCTELGTELTLRSALRDQLALARRVGVEDRFIDYTELVDFSAGFITAAKIDGVAVEDFADPRIAKKSPVPFFQFLAIVETLANRRIYDVILQDNEGTLASKFPNHAKWNINVLSTKISMLMVGLQAQFIAEQARKSPQPLADTYRNAARILEGIEVVREKSRKVLLNPNDPDSAVIREITNVFLKSTLADERTHILQILGLNKLSTLYDVYRQTYRLASSGGGEFYLNLAVAIRDYIDDIATVKDILTDEDIDSFLLGYEVHALLDINIEKQIQIQARHINELTSQTSQRFFEVNPVTIDLGNLATPQFLEVTLDRNRPRKFSVNLVYNNELDEEVEIEYTIDTTKGTFDWNFLEDPSHPENTKIAAMRNQLVLIASTVLAEITAQEAQKRRPIRPTQSTEVQTVIVKRERFDDPIYALRKQIRAEQRAAKAQETEEIDIATALQKGSVKKTILMDNEDLEKRMHIGIDDKQTSLEAIREYNERGVGKFTRKRKRGPDGEPRYTLRVGNSRVLVKEVVGTDGNRNFEILDVRDRKDVYPKNAL